MIAAGFKVQFFRRALNEVAGQIFHNGDDDQRGDKLQYGVLGKAGKHDQQQIHDDAVRRQKGQVEKASVGEGTTGYGIAGDLDCPSQKGIQQKIESQIKPGVGHAFHLLFFC